MTERKNQKDHDSMVETVAKLLIGRGYSDVRADLPEYTKPRFVMWESSKEGFYPDATGIKDGFRIFEVETPDSIDAPETAEQLKLFASLADDKDVFFYIVFPKGYSEKVRNKLDELKIQANLMEL